MTITINAVIKRLNRRFAKEGLRLRKARGRVIESTFGTYYQWDPARNRVTERMVNPEAWARELNLVRHYEMVEVQS